MGTITAFGLTSQFLIEVSKGNVEGHKLVNIISRNPTVGTAYEDLWGPSSAYTKPIINETWEAVSTSANDTSAGTGAQSILVEYLDSDYVTHTATVTMNGITEATIATDCFRPQSSFVLTAGTTKTNEGTITIKSTGGAIRGEISFSDIGYSVTQDGHYTIPINKTGFGLQIIPFYPKNEDGFARSVLQTEDGPIYRGAEFPFYQAGIEIPILAPFSLPEKTDIVFEAKSTNADVQVTLSTVLLLVDSNKTAANQDVGLEGF